MKTSILSCFLLLMVGLVFFSCEQDTKKKLEGTWTMIEIPSKGYEENWEFTDSKIIITHTNPGDTAVPFKSGTYSIKNSTVTTDGDGMGSSGVEYYRGNFEIRSLDGTELILLRKDIGLQYYEFEKKQ